MYVVLQVSLDLNAEVKGASTSLVPEIWNNKLSLFITSGVCCVEMWICVKIYIYRSMLGQFNPSINVDSMYIFGSIFWICRKWAHQVQIYMNTCFSTSNFGERDYYNILSNTICKELRMVVLLYFKYMYYFILIFVIS